MSEEMKNNPVEETVVEESPVEEAVVEATVAEEAAAAEESVIEEVKPIAAEPMVEDAPVIKPIAAEPMTENVRSVNTDKINHAPDSGDFHLEVEDKLAGKNALYKLVYKMSDAQWKKAQIIFALIAAVIVSCCLFLVNPESESSVSWNFVLALAVALLVPRLVEKYLDRSTAYLHRVLLIALAVCILLFTGYTWLTGGFAAKPAEPAVETTETVDASADTAVEGAAETDALETADEAAADVPADAAANAATDTAADEAAAA